VSFAVCSYCSLITQRDGPGSVPGHPRPRILPKRGGSYGDVETVVMQIQSFSLSFELQASNFELQASSFEL